MSRLLKIWLMIGSRAAQTWLLNSCGGFLFLLGKLVRFGLFFIFLFTVLSSTKTLAGYHREQVILFFLVFNLVDVMIQFLFRGVYVFRPQVVSGNYDLDLLKPLPSFFWPLFGWPDILDLITLVPLWGFFLWFAFSNQLLVSVSQFLIFLLFLANSLVIGFAFHLFVCSICVLTTKIDHLIWVYRDLANMAQFPTDIYAKGVQFVLTFTIPVVILITVPAKALLGVLTWPWMILSFVIGGASLWASLKFWRFSLSRYSSASS